MSWTSGSLLAPKDVKLFQLLTPVGIKIYADLNGLTLQKRSESWKNSDEMATRIFLPVCKLCK
jgi:hypothetical protein